MRKEELARFRKLLEDRLAALWRTAHGEAVRQGLRAPTADDEGPGDEGDDAARFQQSDLLMSLAEVDAVAAQKIEAALTRITSGDYGTCLDCGAEIERRRLESLPWAVRCIECQEAFEFDARDHTPSL